MAKLPPAPRSSLSWVKILKNKYMSIFYTKLKIFSLIALLFGVFLLSSTDTFASETDGTIPANSYTWGENIGWINFGATNGNVHVTDTAVTGFAWSANYGWINFSPTNGGVTNTCTGTLGGNAWSSGLGWIPFSGVTINASGKFTGMAGTAGSTAGRINFDCTNCNVTTDWKQCALRATSSTTATTTTTATATPSPTPTPTLAPIGEEKPTASSQLFDIRLLLDSAKVSRIIDLVARVTFESFGRVPTPVSMTFAIHDETGRDIWSAVDTVTVETEQVFVKRFFDAPELAPGNYTLSLTTLYNTDVKDEFEVPFTIVPKGAGWNWVPWFVGGLLLLLAILVFVWWFITRRRRQI